jgi:hypothetical protein
VIDSRDRRPGIFVASPVYGASCYMPYVTGILSLQRACLAAGIGFDYFYVSGTALLHQQRNVAVSAFTRHSDLSHLLFVDADVGFEGEDIVRMFHSGEELVLGPYPAKHINWAAVVATARNHPDLSPAEVALSAADYSTNFYGVEGQTSFSANALNEIHAGGTGLMLIAASVFAKLDAAYPADRGLFPDAYKILVPGVDELVEHFTFITEADGRLLSEDLTFCKKWRDIGGRLYAAPWLRTVHVGPYYFRGELPTLLGAGR